MNKRKYKIYAIDFDGTLCKNMFPKIGDPNNTVINKIKNIKENGNKLILWTCRTGKRLDEAVKWCNSKGIEFDAINNNIQDIINKFKCDSRKIVADYYIDDKAIKVLDFISTREEVNEVEKLEFRENKTEIRALENEENKMIIEGVVNNIGEYSKVLSSKSGKFKEKIDSGVFEKALEKAKKENRDIFLLRQHNKKELPLASINSETMELREENGKLYIRAELPPTTVAKDIYELVKSNVLRDFSFGFKNAKSEWGKDEDNITTRSIKELDLYEVSIVITGAYNNTEIQARSIEIEDIFKEFEERNSEKDIDDNYKYYKSKLNLRKRKTTAK